MASERSSGRYVAGRVGPEIGGVIVTVRVGRGSVERGSTYPVDGSRRDCVA